MLRGDKPFLCEVLCLRHLRVDLGEAPASRQNSLNLAHLRRGEHGNEVWELGRDKTAGIRRQGCGGGRFLRCVGGRGRSAGRSCRHRWRGRPLEPHRGPGRPPTEQLGDGGVSGVALEGCDGAWVEVRRDVQVGIVCREADRRG